jgi:hypothetical protein
MVWEGNAVIGGAAQRVRWKPQYSNPNDQQMTPMTK